MRAGGQGGATTWDAIEPFLGSRDNRPRGNAVWAMLRLKGASTYEIYNLPAGIPYETEISIQPLDDHGNPDGRPVRTTFSGESAAREDDSVAELRSIESALPRGHYRLSVNVRNRISGETASRSRDFEVREWGGGATLVEALPYKER